MKKQPSILSSFPSYSGSVVALAVITTLGLTLIYTMANSSMAESTKWKSSTESSNVTVQEDAEANQLEPNWRYTRQGWQDANDWAAHDTQYIQRPFENIHPSLWATDIVLASIAALVWATDDERQIARLFGRSC